MPQSRIQPLCYCLKHHVIPALNVAEVARRLGVDRRKLDTVVAHGTAAFSYDEGKRIEQMVRAFLDERDLQAGSHVMHVMRGSMEYDIAPGMFDYFAVAFWPTQRLMVAKSIGGAMGGVLPNRSSEARARRAAQTFEAGGVRADIASCEYFEVQRLEERSFVTKLTGLSNGMKGLVAEYEPVDEATSQKILVMSDWF